MKTTPRRNFTARQRLFVLAHYGPLSPEPWTTRRIAATLGRTEMQVRKAAWLWGGSWQERPRLSRRLLRRHYNAGHSDGDVALRCNCSTGAVFRWRKRERLKANRKGWGAKAS